MNLRYGFVDISCIISTMSITKIVLASDHGGFHLKEEIKSYLEEKGIEVEDVGTDSPEPVDYPAIMRAGARIVVDEGVPGIFFGGSGNGEAMSANKVKGIRAALCYSQDTARLARAHNDANVMCLGGRLTEPDLARELVDIFLTTPFEGGRHIPRVNDIDTPLAS